MNFHIVQIRYNDGQPDMVIVSGAPSTSAARKSVIEKMQESFQDVTIVSCCRATKEVAEDAEAQYNAISMNTRYFK